MLKPVVRTDAFHERSESSLLILILTFLKIIVCLREYTSAGRLVRVHFSTEHAPF